MDVQQTTQISQTLWNSNEFVAATVGALIGGFMSMIASYFSIQWQNAKQTKERQKLVRDFVLEHAAYFKELVDRLITHFDQKGEVWAEYVVEIKTAYDVVIRNIENLVLLDQQEDRRACRKYFSDIFFISQRCWLWQNQYYEFQKNIDSIQHSNKSVRDSLEANKKDAISNIKNCVADLKSSGISFFDLERKLKS